MSRVGPRGARPVAIRAARPDDEDIVVGALEAAALEPGFVAAEYVVAWDDGVFAGCARLKPLGGPHAEVAELASVLVAPKHRGTGLGRSLVQAALADAPRRVYALAVEPVFFERLGFVRLDAVPAPLREKAEGFCASQDFVPLVWTRR